ncbi:hypothetical protein F1737_02590 [Methanoplanus sp. FWC-SCC4]|uniref:Uncharacterized protein n=1 Tax=Methanochimaera problematica TaxID=2609417 RepID=A0AA97FDV5_9EURY|nr:hypothetical protein [Methanoplanus sp. FWC-SCC4]WOF15651.1 hypothetical protein F1737_02590 [Methanoplanus sp. FWC-SCC4]
MSGFDDYMNTYIDSRMKYIINEWNLGTGQDFGDFIIRLNSVEKDIRDIKLFEDEAYERMNVLEKRLSKIKEVRK